MIGLCCEVGFLRRFPMFDGDLLLLRAAEPSGIDAVFPESTETECTTKMERYDDPDHPIG